MFMATWVRIPPSCRHVVLTKMVVAEEKGGNSSDLKWLPLPLRPWFWVPFVVVLALGAIGLEVALHFSHRNQGELCGVYGIVMFRSSNSL